MTASLLHHSPLRCILLCGRFASLLTLTSFQAYLSTASAHALNFILFIPTPAAYLTAELVHANNTHFCCRKILHCLN